MISFRMSNEVCEVLELIAAKTSARVSEVKRARILLASQRFSDPSQVAEVAGVNRSTCYKWVARAREFLPSLAFEADWSIARRVQEVSKALADRPRSGASAHYTAEQECEVMAVAIRKPEEFGFPLSHWSGRDMAMYLDESRRIPGISPSKVWRVLKEADLRPHKSQYWLNPKIDDEAEFEARKSGVCNLYLSARGLYEQGVAVVSVDEKTGIQALERIHPDKPMAPGLAQRIEYEYKRHGTTSLIASLVVATGRIDCATLGPWRGELDYADHIRKLAANFPDLKLIIVNDNLTTHKSETLVRLVAELDGIDGQTLGQKGKQGVLKDVQSRQEFLEDRNHRLAFFYTPKHCSWLNQIEIWFGILVKKLLKRASFKSVEQLQKKILEFIDFFNDRLAHPFQWTYKGKALSA